MLDLAGIRVLARAGLLAPVRPDKLLTMGLALARYGISPATGYAAGAARFPHRPAVVDDDGVLTWREVDVRTDRLASELRARGLREGDAAGVLARNGRGLVEGAVALAKVGADVLYLGPGTGAGPLRQVLDRERARAVLHDAELADLVPASAAARAHDRGARRAGPHLHRRARRRCPGTPRARSSSPAARPARRAAPPAAARPWRTPSPRCPRIPLRAGETTVIAAPAFHAWGLGHVSIAMLLGSTVVLSRRFDPERVLASVERHRATALVVVPVMLEGLLAATGSYDTSSLRVIASSGSALPGDLVQRVQARFGPVLHNLYGSTEVAYAAVATPEDLAADPRTAGRPPYGVTLRVVDERGRDVPPGTPGRVFVGSGLTFEGYTDGSDKDRLGALVATGDLGVLDASGRLTVLGREDDMVVIGGENVYPGQVEDVLAQDPSVAEVAVTAVDDPAYGARLVAHVVAAAGAQVDAEHLQALVRGSLARYAVPREVRVVASLPRGATGKVLHRELRGGAAP